MSRSFDATGNQWAAPATSSLLPTTGSLTFWFNPAWSAGDSTDHILVDCESGGDFFRFEKYLDNNCYIGWSVGGVDDRVVIADTGLFTNGTWTHWAITWAASGTTTVYVNGVSKGTHATMASPAVSSQTFFGARATIVGANGLLADVALWSTVLSGANVSSLAGGTRPGSISPAPFTWSKFAGVASPEPDEVGSNPFVLTGSPPQGASDPSFGSSALNFASAATLGAFTPNAALKAIDSIVSAKTLGSFAATAALKAIDKIVSATTLGAFTQSAIIGHGGFVTSSATLGAFTSAAALKDIDKVISAATLGALTNTAALKAIEKIVAAQTISAFTQSGALLLARQITSGATLAPFAQDAVVTTNNPAPTGGYYPGQARRRGRR